MVSPNPLLMTKAPISGLRPRTLNPYKLKSQSPAAKAQKRPVASGPLGPVMGVGSNFGSIDPRVSLGWV